MRLAGIPPAPVGPDRHRPLQPQEKIQQRIHNEGSGDGFLCGRELHQQFLTAFPGKMVDLYLVLSYCFADAMEEADRVAEGRG